MLLNELLPAPQSNFRVEVVYQTNYNGCTVLLHFPGDDLPWDEYEVEKRAPQYHKAVVDLQTAVINHAYKDCDEEYEYNGDTEELAQFIRSAAARVFGPHVQVDVEFDTHST